MPLLTKSEGYCGQRFIVNSSSSLDCTQLNEQAKKGYLGSISLARHYITSRQGSPTPLLPQPQAHPRLRPTHHSRQALKPVSQSEPLVVSPYYDQEPGSSIVDTKQRSVKQCRAMSYLLQYLLSYLRRKETWNLKPSMEQMKLQGRAEQAVLWKSLRFLVMIMKGRRWVERMGGQIEMVLGAGWRRHNTGKITSAGG